MFEIRTKYQIESARFLPHLPKTHPCASMHGHSFTIYLRLRSALNPKIGWVKDYNEVDQIALPILKLVDHKVLNEIPGLENPTTELLTQWLFEKLKPLLPELAQVTVCETANSECSYPVL